MKNDRKEIADAKRSVSLREAMEKALGPPPKAQNRVYEITLAPADPSPHDEGLTIRVSLPARSRRHALQRAARYAPGTLMAVSSTLKPRRSPEDAKPGRPQINSA